MQNGSHQRVGQIILQAQLVSSLEAQNRFIESEDELQNLVNQARSMGLRVVLTQGTFDLVHIGHARYVREAKKHGDLLIVGIDDDEKARERKGENRPFVPFAERREMLCHLRYVDAVVMKKFDHPKWHLIKLVRPDVLIAVEGTYGGDEVKQLKEFCGDVKVLERQAKTSTSAQIRTMVLDGAETLTRVLIERLPQFVHDAYEELKQEHL